MDLQHRTCSVAEYTIEFSTLAAEAGWNESALRSAFHKGLNDETF